MLSGAEIRKKPLTFCAVKGRSTDSPGWSPWLAVPGVPPGREPSERSPYPALLNLCLQIAACNLPCREGDRQLQGRQTWISQEPEQSKGFPSGSDSKESACHVGDPGSIPRLGRSPGGGHGNSLQYSCLENPMDRGAWWATAHGVAQSQTRLSDLAQHRAIKREQNCSEKQGLTPLLSSV